MELEVLIEGELVEELEIIFWDWKEENKYFILKNVIGFFCNAHFLRITLEVNLFV